MDIIAATRGETDLCKFVQWLKDVEGDKYCTPPITYDIEDWDNMCGVNVHGIGSTIFNFHEDGSFRAIIDISDEKREARERASVDKRVEWVVRYMSWWEFFLKKMGR